MKKIFLILAAAAATLSVSAQYYQDNINPEMLRMESPRTLNRKEFHAPSVDGYTAYKADLHNHTIFSDGHLTMQSRVREAWADGLDVIAVTEHLEFRPHEKDLVKYLKGYTGKDAKAKAYDFVSKTCPAKEDIGVDFNVPVEIARKSAKNYDMTIIPGIEVTRKPDEYCHFNALFTKNNNTVLAKSVHEQVQQVSKTYGVGVFNTQIGTFPSVVGASQASCESVFDFEPDGKCAQQYAAAVEEITGERFGESAE